MAESIWVISDIHLGSEKSNHEAFREFIEWASRKQEFKIGGTDKTFKRPSKLILLGDILELWNPIENDFKNVAAHLLKSLKPLLDFSHELILVTGNHDEALEGYEGEYDLGTSYFTVSAKHYPKEKPRYIEVGGIRYFFLHGHQFDRLFIGVGPLSSIPSAMAELNHIYQTYLPLEGWMLPLVFLGGVAARLLIGRPPVYFLYLTAALSIPLLFTSIQGFVWRRFGRYLTDRPRHLEMERLVARKYYDTSKDTVSADMVVYGHTHLPEISGPRLSKSMDL